MILSFIASVTSRGFVAADLEVRMARLSLLYSFVVATDLGVCMVRLFLLYSFVVLTSVCFVADHLLVSTLARLFLLGSYVVIVMVASFGFVAVGLDV